MTSYQLMRQMAFTLDAEAAHNLTITLAEKFPGLGQFWEFDRQSRWRLQTALGPVGFPIGLAAGLDKDARCLEFFSNLGFGFLEVGTVTLRPQLGNPRPRLWRLTENESLRNAMGFNNHGPLAMAHNIQRWRQQARTCETLIGINLGKNKDTPAERAHEDYQELYRQLAPLADYMVINVSSPNTPGLRDLQSESSMLTILQALAIERKRCPRPLFIKISPDLAMDALETLVGVGQREKLAGLIATNTTIIPELGAGGVSGKLLNAKALQMRTRLLEISQGTGLEIIGVGGVSSFQDVWDFWRRGGRLMQVYTGLIYQGPQLLLDIATGVERALEKTQCASLAQMLSDWRELPETI